MKGAKAKKQSSNILYTWKSVFYHCICTNQRNSGKWSRGFLSNSIHALFLVGGMGLYLFIYQVSNFILLFGGCLSKFTYTLHTFEMSFSRVRDQITGTHSWCWIKWKLIGTFFTKPHFSSYRWHLAKHMNYSLPTHFWTRHRNVDVNPKSCKGELHRNKAEISGFLWIIQMIF